MKNKALIIGLVSCVSLLSLISCSKKLDREKAKELIIQKYQFPSIATEKLQYGEINYMTSLGGSNISAEQSLANQNLIIFSYQGDKRDMFFSYKTYYLELTPEGEKYLVGDTIDNEGRKFYIVKAAERMFIEITGILQKKDDNTARSEFTWKYINITPFGKAISLKNEQLNQSDEFMKGRTIYNEEKVYKNTEYYTRYDDGWRINY